jgi:hypothetical protein
MPVSGRALSAATASSSKFHISFTFIATHRARSSAPCAPEHKIPMATIRDGSMAPAKERMRAHAAVN